ncbi:Predicted AD-superfamily hydrolase subfamily IA [gamma proteobacterium HdN1]|nr:Predicted AD-superfamily hydrolase subfamily IA [gamma proteobacterium HdN1]
MKYECVIFDWDGTLVDSLGHIVTSMREAAHSITSALRSDQQIKNIIGLELSEAIRTLYPELSEQDVQQVRERYAHFYVAHQQDPTQFFAGIPALMDDLRRKSCTLGVATGKSRRGLDRVMQTLDAESWFAATRCADETKGKPEPDMVLELLDAFSVRPEHAVVVGDSHFDIEMAQRAGVHGIAVGWGAQPLSSFAHSPQVTTVNDLAALRRALGI